MKEAIKISLQKDHHNGQIGRRLINQEKLDTRHEARVVAVHIKHAIQRL